MPASGQQGTHCMVWHSVEGWPCLAPQEHRSSVLIIRSDDISSLKFTTREFEKHVYSFCLPSGGWNLDALFLVRERWSISQAKLYGRGKGKGKENGLSTYCVLIMYLELHRGRCRPLASVIANSSPSDTRQVTRMHEAARQAVIGSSGAHGNLKRGCVPCLKAIQILFPLKILNKPNRRLIWTAAANPPAIWIYKPLKATGSRVLGFKFSSGTSSAVWPWASHLTSLCDSFLICKIEITTLLMS